MNGYLPTLDGWRAVAIVMVMAYHLLDPSFEKNTWMDQLVHRGARGVDIFFGLSGLLITLRLLEERNASGSISLRAFYARRAFRILPPYLTYLAVIVGLAGLGVVKVSRRELLSCLLFYRNYLPLPDLKNWYTAHFWTLSVEEHFYLILPLVLICSSLRGATAVTAASAVGVAIWRKIEAHYAIVAPDQLGRTDLCIDGLIWGAFAALLLQRLEFRTWIGKQLTPSRTWLIVVSLVGLIWFEPPFGITIRGFLIPWMLVGTVINSTAGPGRFLESRPFRWVGRLSYSLYLWQQLGLSAIWDQINPPSNPWMSRPMIMVLGMGSTFLLATASHYWIERPFLRLGKRWTERSGWRTSGRPEPTPALATIPSSRS
jgi:peptidoglycan/LPS O-acetylase OafA/YrhL